MFVFHFGNRWDDLIMISVFNLFSIFENVAEKQRLASFCCANNHFAGTYKPQI